MRSWTLLVVVLLLAPATAAGAPARGEVRIEASDATAHDRRLLEALARDLEGSDVLWDGAPRGAKTFRLRTYARGGVRGLTELASSLAPGSQARIVACKLLRHRLWRLPLRSAAPRTLVVTVRFRPRRP